MKKQVPSCPQQPHHKRKRLLILLATILATLIADVAIFYAFSQ